MQDAAEVSEDLPPIAADRLRGHRLEVARAQRSSNPRFERRARARRALARAVRVLCHHPNVRHRRDRNNERLFDNTRHALTLGFGLDGRSVPLSLDLFAQGHLLASRTHRLPSGEARTSGAIWAGGGAATVRF